MAIKLSKIKSQTRTLSPIMFGEDALNVEFYVNVYTPRYEEESQRRRDSGIETTAGEALGLMVVPLIASWDLYDEFEVGNMITTEEQMINITEDGVTRLIPPPTNPWRFYYEDQKTHRLIEDMRETVISRDDTMGTCQVRRFVQYKQEIKDHLVPITVAGLSNIPMTVMTEILRRIGEELTPGEEKSSSSEESSFTDEA